ncbi:MAG: tRNA (adenosine(37)-N6)-threonylcarbamoyltransferase complex ATPase subunit type 1 TsaE, partial [Clostridia bacterium]|nr:tRNA (adenosine(37)-N6)-threonylcarbamoyltransferase complex ATPase subunit type 1 TsaE [Clostridia bacterium]
MKQTFSVKNISGMAVFSALSLVVYLLEIPIFAGTPANFLELDFSNVFVLLAGFMYGPLPAIIITLVKEGIHVFIGTTGGVGELANIIITTAFIIVPTILYRFKKGIVTVILSLVVASIIQSGISLLVNKYINFPFFMGSAPFKPTAVSNATFNELWAYVLAFNAIKSVAVSIVTILLYKKVSYLFRKIHLQNSRDSVYNKGGEKTSNEFITKNAEETMQVACNLAKTLTSGEVLLLSGDLGAGKTVFTKGLAKGLNISDEVVSPTYAYLNVYGDYLYH